MALSHHDVWSFEGVKMIKKLIAGATLAVAMLAPMAPAVAGPGGCICTWMATGYDVSTGEYTYEWVCPEPATCEIQVTPEG